ncbi:MAG: hypothetical protein J5I52_10245 [Saprospiraceae bacterium]|nr:hypothetical protein [Saprospiraceae bacterium]
MKSIALLLMFFMCILSVSAQMQQLEEVVYLKNGSVVRGVIIEQVPNERIRIQTRDGNIFVYTYNEIEKITKEAQIVPQNRYSNANSQVYSDDINKYKKGGASSTVLGVTFFAVGMPFMIQGIRGSTWSRNLYLGRLIPGTMLTAAGIPLMIIGPAKLGKYSQLKREAQGKVGIDIYPSIQSVDNNTLPAMYSMESLALGGSIRISF